VYPALPEASTRHILKTINDEALSTIIAEVEFIINSRPLCPIFESPDNLQSISPNNFLMFNPIESLRRSICLRRLRQIQYLIDVFWKCYIKEYMPLLNRRQKWIRPKRNSKVGDLVLLHDPDIPRGRWPIGRTIEAIPSPNDNFVRTSFILSRVF